MFTVTYQRATSVAPARKCTGRDGHQGKHSVGQQSAEAKYALGRQSPQTKLNIGPGKDRYEQEADRVADQAMGMADTDATAVGL